MPRFKRILWLLAWGVWAYLGVGLYRELPRDLGPIVRRLPFGDDKQPIGWLDGKTLITESSNGDRFTGGNKRYQLWDVASGKMTVDREGPLIDSPRPPTFYTSPPLLSARQGVVIGRSQAMAPRALELRTGRWTNLGTDRSPIEIHPLRPWVALRHDGVDRRSSAAIVVDHRTGAVVFERQMQEDERLNSCHFVDDSDILLVDIRSADDEWRNRKQTFERWDAGVGTRLSTFTISDTYAHTSRPGANGLLIGYRPWSDGRRFDVVDPVTGAEVYQLRSTHDFTSFWTGPEMYASDEREASLSADGRALLNNGSLVALPSGATLQRGDEESIWFESRAKGESVRVEERFGLRLRDLLPATVAFRDPGTNQLLHRVRATHPRLIEDDAGRLACDRAGNVHELPLRVNYPLLALCQAILALPLVLLLALLRWRRRRTARRLVEAAP